MRKFVFAFVIMPFLMSGCVSSQEHGKTLAELDQERKKIAATEEKLKNLENSFNSLKTENGSLKDDKAKLENDLTALKAEKSKLEGELAVLKNDKSRLDVELFSLKADKQRLEGELAEVNKKLVESNRQTALLIENNKAVMSENSGLKQALETKKDELRNEIYALKGKIAEQEKKAKELDARIKEKDDKQVQVVADYERKIKELNDVIKDSDARIASLMNEVGGLSKEKAAILADKEEEITRLKNTRDSLTAELTKEIKTGEIEIVQLRDKLTVSMVDKIIFDSGSAEVKKEGKAVLDRVGGILKKVKDKQIKVEGHTDNVKISSRLTKKFPTNWELSTARANNVVRYLQDKVDIDPTFLIASGYSEYRPIAPNDSDANRAKNRRIEIVLVPLELERKTK